MSFLLSALKISVVKKSNIVGVLTEMVEMQMLLRVLFIYPFVSARVLFSFLLPGR